MSDKEQTRLSPTDTIEPLSCNATAFNKCESIKDSEENMKCLTEELRKCINRVATHIRFSYPSD